MNIPNEASESDQNQAVVVHESVFRLLAAWSVAGQRGYEVNPEVFLGTLPTDRVLVVRKTPQDAPIPGMVSAQGTDAERGTGLDVDGVSMPMANAFDPEQPRDTEGKWTAAGAFAAKHGLVPIERVGVDEKGKGGRWQLRGGGEVPEHAKGIIPPAYREAHINPDPTADVQGVGTDSQGRTKRFYSQAFEERQAAQKFERVESLRRERDQVFAQTDSDLTNADPAVRENASALKLIQTTGIRPGSETDTKAKVQAYGATTLEGRHVVIDQDGGVRLQFVGKEGKNLDIPVDDKRTADLLRERAIQAGPTGKLFATDDAAVRDYAHSRLDKGRFKPKDFRTLKGTEEASALVNQEPARASSMKDYKRRVMAVAKRVAEKLGNTPAIALQRYISPSVFAAWKPA